MTSDERSVWCILEKDYLPFIPEEQRILLWGERFENGKFSDYTRAARFQKRVIRHKILQQKCGQENNASSTVT